MLYGNKKIINHKVGLLNLAEELGNAKACRIIGVSRDTFYRYKSAIEEGGIESLFDQTRRKPNLKNRVDEQTEKAVVEYATSEPAHGQVRVSNELRKRGIFVSPIGVRSIWLRNNLGRFRERLRSLEERMAKDKLILTESQISALEKKKEEDMVFGEIETSYPGYFGSQDTSMLEP